MRKQNLYDCQIKGSVFAKKKITEVTRRDVELFKVELEELTKSNYKKKLINNNTKNKVLTPLVEVFAEHLSKKRKALRKYSIIRRLLEFPQTVMRK